MKKQIDQDQQKRITVKCRERVGVKAKNELRLVREVKNTKRGFVVKLGRGRTRRQWVRWIGRIS